MSCRSLSPLDCSIELTRSSPIFPNMQFPGTDFARQNLFFYLSPPLGLKEVQLKLDSLS